jgi:phage replication-related protein YjqB (UPF0714/DUF867 family)
VATREAVVKPALTSQRTLRHRAERCSVDPDQLRTLGLASGSQVRVRRGPHRLALYTISELRHEANDAIVRMAAVARQRLGTDGEFEATLDTRVQRSTLSDEEARDQSEFVERLDDNGIQRHLIALAPHGGAIERQTDLQAERVAGILGPARASAWRCKGFKNGGGALQAWHITSTDISDSSFPLLRRIARRRFSHAVAFHGFAGAGVLVGGAASQEMKDTIAEAIRDVLHGSSIRVRVALPEDDLNGSDPKNVVNRVTRDGRSGVQIEQSAAARRRFWAPIACAVAATYARVFDAAR